ncbi:protein kinase [Sorangium sp. So ce281]|uniref:protein kinase domain-containing protein n=1 Tax=Sorangium sp. So ce281 TaxID=3133293 RepID=UPI003F5F9228
MRCSECHRRLPARAGAACPAHPLAPSSVTSADEREHEALDQDPSPLVPGLRVEGFRVERLLGQGGFARVYAATREGDGRAVALKVARRQDDGRIEREAAALARLAPPLVPALLGRGRSEELGPFLVLERLEGSSLARCLADLPGTGAMPVEQASAIVRALSVALDAAHEAGLVHRDLKPENVWLRPGGEVALIDFGLAAQARAGGDARAPLGPDLTQTGAILGTAAYMAPEQCLGAGAVDARADIYALGAMIFELLTGRPPFVGEAAEVRQAHVARRPAPPSSLAPLPEGADEAVLRCLAKDPEARPARASDVARALAASLEARAAPSRGRAASSGAPAPATDPRRSVALLALRTRERADALADIARAEGGVLARFRGERMVLAFPAADAPGDGVRAAARVARRLAEAGATEPHLVVHLAPLRVREGTRGVTLAGAALEDAETWGAGPGDADAMPPAILTAEARRALADGPHDASPSPRAVAPDRRDRPLDPRGAPPDEPGETALRGRDAALGAALAAAQEALAGGGPALVTALGAEGHGKSRFLGALAAALHAGGAAVHAAAALRPEAAEHGATLVALLRAALDLPAGGERDADAQEALVQRLGAAEAARAWPAVGLALGRLAPGDPAAAPLLGAPGARRHAEARALAAALAAAAPLALLLDDADRADASALDAIELATAEGSAARLAIVLAARPSLASLRPALGERAARRVALDLGPLDAEAAGALLQDRLRPVEFIPRAVLDRLHALARGVPRDLVEVACALRVGGAIQRARGGEGWTLAPDDLLSLSAAPLGERLAERALAALPPPLVDLLERAAILGDDLSPAELEAALRAADAPPPAGALDPGVGLARLARAGVLVARSASPPRYAFRHPLLREAVEARIPPARRRALHAAVLQGLLGAPRAAGARARIARHAAAAGDLAAAAAAHAELADEALARHDVVEAEQRFTAALRLAGLLERDDASTRARARALAGRGRARYRLQRFEESLADLRAARALAEAAGDRARAAELLLEEATALDWLEDFPASAAIAARAAELCAGLGDARLDARCLLAGGRSDCRDQRVDEGIPKLERAARGALALGDHEAHVIARLVLVASLSVALRLDEAERHAEAVVEACLRAGDVFHLCTAYINRVFMWVKRREEGRAVADQREAVRLARELGHAQLERWATLNLAELRYWLGAPDEALPLARRSLDLQRRYFNKRPSPDDVLLLARIHVARGEHDEAARHLAETRASLHEPNLTPCARTLARLVQQALDDRAAGRFDAAAWRALVDEARQTAILHEHAEALHSAALSALRAGEGGEARLFLAEARAMSAGFWQRRFDEIERALLTPGATGAA